MKTSTSHHQSLFIIISNSPLFSCIVTIYTLILLFFPQFFLKIIFSPLLISTLVLLLFLLQAGTSQQVLNQQSTPPPPQFCITNNYDCEGALFASSHTCTKKDLKFHGKRPPTQRGPENKPEPNMEGIVLMQEEAGEIKETECKRAEAQLALEPSRAEPEPKFSSKNLLEWDVGAPLEVIYEAYEGEEEAQNDEFWRDAAVCCNNKAGKIERYPSLSRYYPETDSDSSSGSDSDSEDEEREGLIEIALDYGFGDKRVINLLMKIAEKQDEFHFDDEDSLIEIDISSTKNT